MELKKRLTGKNEKLIALTAAIAAFGTYSCMYALNYQRAVDALGGDNINARGWWDE